MNDEGKGPLIKNVFLSFSELWKIVDDVFVYRKADSFRIVCIGRDKRAINCLKSLFPSHLMQFGIKTP